MLLVSDICAQLDKRTLCSRILPFCNCLLDACGEGLIILLLEHFRGHIVVGILNTRDQPVLTPGNLATVTHLQGAAGRRCVGKPACVIANQARNELLGFEMSCEGVAFERQATAEFLADVKDPELGPWVEEV